MKIRLLVLSFLLSIVVLQAAPVRFETTHTIKKTDVEDDTFGFRVFYVAKDNDLLLATDSKVMKDRLNKFVGHKIKITIVTLD